MSIRCGVNRFLLVVIILTTIRSGGDLSLFVWMMLGGPVLAILLVRAFFWIIEGFKGSPLE
jgi:hypothetical protein